MPLCATKKITKQTTSGHAIVVRKLTKNPPGCLLSASKLDENFGSGDCDLSHSEASADERALVTAQPFFCASPPDGKEGSGAAENGPRGPPTSANIAMTTIRPLTIAVDEVEETAWVDAGIRLNDALDYLGNFVTQNAPRGWTLGAQPICIGQSVGGAVSTGTHGSSLVHGSLSKQVLALRVVFANGTAGEITPESHPFLMKVLHD